MQVIYMKGGFKNKVKQHFKEFIGDHECKDVVDVCLHHLLKVFGDVVDNIVDSLKKYKSQGFRMAAKYQNYDVHAEYFQF